MKKIEEFINYYIRLDKEMIEIGKSLDNFKQPYNLGSSYVHVSLIKGNQIIDEKNNKVYKVIGDRLFKKKYGALILAKNFLELNFFLPFEIIYFGENFSIISQELVELKTNIEIEKMLKNIDTSSLIYSDLQTTLIQDKLQFLIYKDYNLEYEKILSLINFLNVLDIAIHNIGFKKEKIVCFDLEPFKRLTIDELKNFLIQNNCYNKIKEYPEVFYLIYE